MRKIISLKPWKPQYVQQLFLNDFDGRIEMAEGFIQWCNEWPELLSNILWSDEAAFHVGGFVNKRNCHYWTQHSPKQTIEKMQTWPKLTVWCEFASSQVVGLFTTET